MSTTLIFENGQQRQACPHQLIFEDNFDTLDTTKWNSLNRFAGLPVRIVNRCLLIKNQFLLNMLFLSLGS